jgi:hypothetical protein
MRPVVLKVGADPLRARCQMLPCRFLVRAASDSEAKPYWPHVTPMVTPGVTEAVRSIS